MVVRQCIGLLAFASVAASQPAPGGKLPPKVKPGNRRNNNNNNNANNNDPGANVADAEKMGWDYPDELQRMLDDSLMGEEYPDGLGLRKSTILFNIFISFEKFDDFETS